jgi:hypothetical protein
MRPYRPPDSEAAALLRQDSYRTVATQLGERDADSCESLARHYVARLNASLRLLQRERRGRSPEAAALKRERTELSRDPSAVFAYSQRLIDERFGRLTARVESWLTDNPRALAMLDRAHLLRVLDGRAGSTRWSRPRLFAEAARQMQVFALFDAGFGAAAPADDGKALEIGAGIYDGISAATDVIVGGTVRLVPGRGLRARNLRERPALFAKTRRQLESVLAFAEGRRKRPTTPFPADTASRRIADELQCGAESFVVLHELAHVLLPSAPDAHEEEHKSDEFAGFAIAGSNNAVLITGMGLGLMMLTIVLRQTGHHRMSDTHPSIVRRYNRLLRLLGTSSAQIGPWLDALLTAPNRLIEEQAFRVETAPAIRLNFRVRLMDAWRKTPRAKAAGDVAAAIVDRGLRLPTIDERTDHTLWIDADSGQRAMALVVDLVPTLKAARAVLAKNSRDRDTDAELAVEAVLRLLSMLTYSAAPPLSAIRILNGLTYAGPKIPPTSTQLNEGLRYLGELGCIAGSKKVRLRPSVDVTFYASQDGF